MHHTETNGVALGMCCINMTAPQGKELKSGRQGDELDRQNVF